MEKSALCAEKQRMNTLQRVLNWQMRERSMQWLLLRSTKNPSCGRSSVYRTYRDLWSTDTYRRSVDNVRDEWNESILPDTSCIVKADAGYDQKDRIIDYVKRCTKALERLGVKEGTMAIAGLNPHSGEHGLFGWEEVEEIMPAIEELKAEGYDVAGPIGADSVFHQAAQENIPVYYRCITIRDISQPRHWTSKRRSQSQMVCRSFVHR